jgi:hypothetical protein
MDQRQDTEAALTQLYRYAEGRAIDAVDWYLADKRGRRIRSRGLRLLVILLVTGGGSWSGTRVRPVPGPDPEGSRTPAGDGAPSPPATPAGR